MSIFSSFRDELTQTLRDAAGSVTTPEAREDLRTLQRLLLQRSEPSIAVVGSDEVSLQRVFETLGLPRCDEVSARLGVARWYAHAQERGTLHVADLRGEAGLRALEYQCADAVIAVVRSGEVDVAEAVSRLREAVELTADVHDAPPVGLLAVFRTDESQRASSDFKTVRALRAEIAAQELPSDWADVECVARLGDGPKESLTAPIAARLPVEARFSLARLSSDRGAQRAVAYEVVRLASTLNAAIATVPIPVAGAIPITSVQIAMIAGIAALSGRQLRVSTVAEFGTAVGLNVGAAVALREVARALIGWIPVAGPAISASIAAGATMTLGRAAMRHYLQSR